MSIVHSKFKSSGNQNKVERNFYKVWSEMNRRCSRKTSKRNTKSYFGKGIKVCESWKNFDNFFKDMWETYLLHRKLTGGNTELNRVNNDEDYSKMNCCWSTRLENMNNTSNVRRIRGKTFSEWSKILGINSKTLIRRYEVGWKIDRVLSPKLERVR